MIPIKRVDHISMAAADWRAQLTRLERLLGFKYLRQFEPAPGSDFEGGLSQVRGTGIEFEVIAPNAPDSFVQKYLDDQGPGLHHITVEVEDVQAAARELERLGITPFGGVVDDGSWYVTYIHPKDSGGVLWQLFTPYKQPPEMDREAGGGVVGLRRMDHVSLATRDIEWQIAFQERVFGMELLQRWTVDVRAYHGAVMSIPNSLLKFEMVQAFRPDSFVHRFIEQRGRPGLHHICCEVASVDDTYAALQAEGIQPHGGIIAPGKWHRHTFLHPRDSGGVLFQLFEGK